MTRDLQTQSQSLSYVYHNHESLPSTTLFCYPSKGVELVSSNTAHLRRVDLLSFAVYNIFRLWLVFILPKMLIVHHNSKQNKRKKQGEYERAYRWEQSTDCYFLRWPDVCMIVSLCISGQDRLFLSLKTLAGVECCLWLVHGIRVCIWDFGVLNQNCCPESFISPLGL